MVADEVVEAVGGISVYEAVTDPFSSTDTRVVLVLSEGIGREVEFTFRGCQL